MIPRILEGNRSGVVGFYISKPGIDVRFAAPGDCLIDTTSTIYQIVFAGLTNVRANASSSVSIPLPASVAPYTNLFCWSQWYFFNPENGLFGPDDRSVYGAFVATRVAGGAVTIDTSFGSISAGKTMFVRWAIFRNSL